MQPLGVDELPTRHRVRTLPLLVALHLLIALVACLSPCAIAGRVMLDRSVVHRQLLVEDEGISIPLLIGYKNERGKQAIKNHTVPYDDDDNDDEEEGGGHNSGFTIRNKQNRKENKEQGAAKSTTKKKKKRRHGRLQGRVPVVAAMITSIEQLDALENDPDVDYIEEDSIVRLLSSEVVPAGLTAIQAPLLFGSMNNGSSSSGGGSAADCSDPNVFKVGIVDSGSDSSHPDSPCYDFTSTGGNGVSSGCLGETFGLDSTMTWNAPADSHGTLVTGIIGAVRNNGAGLVGIVDSNLFCFVVARVFASVTANALMSDVLEGMEWAVDQGARVVNLSLGGPTNSTTAKLMYDNLQSRGVLVVSAAGNDGTSGTGENGDVLNVCDSIPNTSFVDFARRQTDYSYPASYDSVLSVGAIDDSTNDKASFSNYNDEVDVAAPGVQVLSTGLPSSTSLVFLSPSDDAGSSAVTGKLWQASGQVASQSGILIDCGTGLDSPCDTSAAGGGASICLIQRQGLWAPMLLLTLTMFLT
jgi:Subtilase family